MINNKPILSLPKNARQLKTQQQLEQVKISHCLLFPSGTRPFVRVTIPGLPDVDELSLPEVHLGS